MKKLVFALAVLAALLLTAWTTYRATMRNLEIEIDGSEIYVTAWGRVDVYELEEGGEE